MPDILERKIGGWNTLRKTFVAGMIYARKISFEENPSEVTSVKKNFKLFFWEFDYINWWNNLFTGAWKDWNGCLRERWYCFGFIGNLG